MRAAVRIAINKQIHHNAISRAPGDNMTQSSNGSIEAISHRFDRALASIKSAWIDARRPIADSSTDRALHDFNTSR
jgi:hypothetical protein